MTDSHSLAPPAGHSPAGPTWRAPFGKYPPPGSPSGPRFTEPGPHPKLGAGRRWVGTHVELAALTKPLRALRITSGPGQCPCSLDGPGLHVPGSCDRGFLDLSGGLGLAIKRSSSSRPSSLSHPLALIASLGLNYPRHSQNANKGLTPSFVLS